MVGEYIMNSQKINGSLLFRKLSFLFVAVLLAGLALVVILIPIARANTYVFVRPGGDDVRCNGFTNLDYSPEIAPACAVQSLQKGLSLAGPNDTVIFTDI